MRLSVFVKSDSNDTSHQKWQLFTYALLLTRFPEEKFVLKPSSGYSSESTISDPDLSVQSNKSVKTWSLQANISKEIQKIAKFRLW